MGCHHRVSNGNDRLHFDVDYAADLLCNILFPPYHWRHNQSINQFILNIDQVQMPPFMPLQSNMTRRQCANSGWMSRLWVWLMPTSTSNMATKHHSRDYKTHTNSYKFYHSPYLIIMDCHIEIRWLIVSYSSSFHPLITVIYSDA